MRIRKNTKSHNILLRVKGLLIHSPVDVPLEVPHQLISPMLSMIAEEGVLADETTSAPVGHLQLMTPTTSNTPDQKRF